MIRTILLGLLSLHLLGTPFAAFAEAPRFNRDILPILADHCFKCHGADGAAREAGLRLDTEAGAKALLKSEASAVIPGDRHGSALFQRIIATDDDRMPPLETA